MGIPTLKAVVASNRRHVFGTFQRAICAALLALLAISCQAGVPEIIPLPGLTAVATGVAPSGAAYKIRREYFVVADAPADQGAIRQLIGGYLATRLGIGPDQSYTLVIQSFYKETEDTPRNYAESNRGYFYHDRIEDHARDILVVVKSYPAEGTREFRFYSPEELP